MAYDTRKILTYAAIGIITAVVIFAAVFTAPTLFPPAEAKTGTLRVQVTDAPVPDLIDLNITITSVEVLNQTGNWTALQIPAGKAYFDLLKLENVTRDLVNGTLPAGNYTKIRMEIATANATLGDGSKIPLNVPPGHIDIQVQFEIIPANTTILIIDIIADKVHIAERGKSGKPANLNPQFKAVVVPP